MCEYDNGDICGESQAQMVAALNSMESAQHIPQHSNGARAEATLPRCSMCECKCADCAYGDLRGSQSCYDTRQRHHCQTVVRNRPRGHMESAQHIPQQPQHKICPSCKSKLWNREVASGKCWNCGTLMRTVPEIIKDGDWCISRTGNSYLISVEDWQTLKTALAQQTNNSAMDAIAWLERCFKYVPDCTWRDDLRRFIELQRHQ